MVTKEVELGPFKMVGPKGKQRKEFIEPRFTVVLKTLGAKDSMIADDYAGGTTSDVKAQKVYAICAIDRINGKQVHPLQDAMQFDRVLDQFDGPTGLIRLQRLVRAFFEFANEVAEQSDPKGLLDAPPFDE